MTTTTAIIKEERLIASDFFIFHVQKGFVKLALNYSKNAF